MEFLEHAFPGQSQAMVDFRQRIFDLNEYCRRYKGSIRSLLLTGPTGAGKTFTARAISAHSQWLTLSEEEKRDTNLCDRSSGTILLPANELIDRLLWKEHLPERGKAEVRTPRLATVLCPLLNRDTVASELFGHKKGAFTGAVNDHPGLFGSTAVEDVLLDEVADLDPVVQGQLLQFLDHRTYRPVGAMAEEQKESDHRLFLATNKVLERLVREGKFREDLLARVQLFHLPMPPLRERRDVIRPLAHSVLRAVNFRHRGPKMEREPLNDADKIYATPVPGKGPWFNWVMRIEEEDLQWCEQHDWPHNIRELEQRLELYVFHQGRVRVKDVATPRAAAQPSLMLGEESSPDLVKRAVQTHLDRVLENQESPPGSLTKMMEHFAELVRNAFLAYKDDRRLTGEETKRMFPELENPADSISQLRRRAKK